MEKFQKIVNLSLLYIVGALGIIAFTVSLCGYYWHIATGTICLLLFMALKHDLKREEEFYEL